MSDTDESSEAFGVDPSEVAGALLIDVRRAPAFEQSHQLLPTANWRDPAQVDEWAGTLAPGKDVVVYCVYGHQVSRTTAMRLRALGLNARFLRGGFDGWQNAGLPLVNKGEAK